MRNNTNYPRISGGVLSLFVLAAGSVRADEPSGRPHQAPNWGMVIHTVREFYVSGYRRT